MLLWSLVWGGNRYSANYSAVWTEAWRRLVLKQKMNLANEAKSRVVERINLHPTSCHFIA